MATQYPKPDRSDYTPNFEVTSLVLDHVDRGWAEGQFVDGRPYRAELWTQEGYDWFGVYFCATGMEGVTEAAMADMLEREGLVTFEPGKREVYASMLLDPKGNRIWEVTMILADEDTGYIRTRIALSPYKQRVAARLCRILRQRQRALSCSEPAPSGHDMENGI